MSRPQRASGAVASMTGFATASHALPSGTLGIELRSVNSRFLDLVLRVPDELRQFEAVLREGIGAQLQRGKVECRVTLQRHASAQAPRLNEAVLAQLAGLSAQVAAAVPGVAPLRVVDVLGWPGVLDTQDVDPDALRAAVQAALAEALDALQASRQREGETQRAALLERCDAIERIAATVQPRVPEIVAAIERKLTERMEQALGKAVAGSSVSREELAERVRQEVTLYGLRVDVDEEINRLRTHVAEVRRVLAAGGAVGRRLDFLMQELNREANTLGSKATMVDLTQAAVELKILIEQMREQIQNIE
jgi:uncharacterized protein (TIGR00255 family)